jgi:hypothetical protein
MVRVGKNHRVIRVRVCVSSFLHVSVADSFPIESESDIRKESRLPHRLKARSHTGPAAFSGSKHVDYEAQLVVAGMRILAAQREAEERFSLQGRDDSSGTPSMRDSGSSANTSNSTKSLHSGRKASKKRRGR